MGGHISSPHPTDTPRTTQHNVSQHRGEFSDVSSDRQVVLWKARGGRHAQKTAAHADPAKAAVPARELERAPRRDRQIRSVAQPATPPRFGGEARRGQFGASEQQGSGSSLIIEEFQQTFQTDIPDTARRGGGSRRGEAPQQPRTPGVGHNTKILFLCGGSPAGRERQKTRASEQKLRAVRQPDKWQHLREAQRTRRRAHQQWPVPGPI